MLNHVHEGRLSYERLVDLMAYGPSRVHKIKNKCFIKENYDADFTIVDPKLTHIITNDDKLQSLNGRLTIIKKLLVSCNDNHTWANHYERR